MNQCYMNSLIKFRAYLKSKTGNPLLDSSYIIVKSIFGIRPRKITRKDESVVWAWDNLNIDGPIVSFGGVYGDEILPRKSKHSKSSFRRRKNALFQN